MGPVKIKGLLDGEELPKELPNWFKDFLEGRKCNWHPDSKGGEPNCKPDLPKTPLQQGDVSLYFLRIFPPKVLLVDKNIKED